MSNFVLEAPYQPAGDQPHAISELVAGALAGNRFQTLYGVTGSGKTYTLANIIAQLNRPTLIMAHNKTLAAQLASEYKEYFPNHAVEYFISFYDYYQPESYLPTTDTYIEKDSSINDEIDRLRHKATYSLLNRRDVIIVASVSCIYGLGSPEAYAEGSFMLEVGATVNRERVIDKLVSNRYERNDVNVTRGKFRVHGEVIEIFLAYDENILRIEFWGDEIESIAYLDPLNRTIISRFERFMIYPASHYVVANDDMKTVIKTIRAELKDQLAVFKAENKLLEYQRLEQRTNYDLDMMQEVGYCSGIENYSRHLTGRNPGEPPYTLMDYFPDDMLVIVDESHQTLPQVRGMFAGDFSRKSVLVEHGFRLPSALDNRPLHFSEFEAKMKQAIFVSATPGPYEREHSTKIVEQIIRPTGLLDPRVDVRKSEGQLENLMLEIRKRVDQQERTLVVTITKKMAEELTQYLMNKGIRTRYLHSDVAALDRFEILHDLRAGAFDVLVGINLLREGLDLPEVSLIGILDADKEGFLRDERSLIQTMGRAARNMNGTVILYADRMTNSMERAIAETQRRRAVQEAHNQTHGITPQTILSKIKDNIRGQKKEQQERMTKKMLRDLEWLKKVNKTEMAPKDLIATIDVLRKEMRVAAKEMEYEKAAILRDKIRELEQDDPLDA